MRGDLPLPLVFWKWDGLGNDFVLILTPEGPPPEAEALARELCDRHRGIGADGLVFVTPTAGGVGMEIYNADGSLAQMCGNAIRCVAALGHRESLFQGDRTEVSTRSGPREVRILAAPDPWVLQVDMGEPRVLEEAGSLKLGEEFRPCATLSMGNPHRVVFVEDLDSVNIEQHGPLLERSHPQGLNVEFVRVLGPDHLAVRVWERGVGLTLACGTGACAALVAASMAGLTGRKAQVDLPGGALEVEWQEDDRVRLVGPARQVFRGEYTGC
ncbi:MAG: diaminopimelate epimerase [Candidatus Xenobium sp.]|jgi:diaminopimelate epimerase|nr:diaminopimelate epimerase [Burkholderiales bacterium]